MQVTCHYKSDDQPLVCAYPASTGVLIRFCSGNVLDPYFGNWFKEPYFKLILKYTISIWASLLWITGVAALGWFVSFWFLLLCLFTPGFYFAWRIGSWWGGYVGWQVYGVDSPQYKNFIDPAEVYGGSQAMSFTARLTTHVD